MLEYLDLVVFENGKYGLQNTLTGYFVLKGHEVAEFKTEKKALKYALKINRRVAKTIRRLNKRSIS